MRAYTIFQSLCRISKLRLDHCLELSVHLRVCDFDSARGWLIILALTDAGEIGTMVLTGIIKAPPKIVRNCPKLISVSGPVTTVTSPGFTIWLDGVLMLKKGTVWA